MPAEQAITIERSSRASVEEVWELGTTPNGVPLIRSVPQQTLHTKRLTLVPLTDEHLEWEVELHSDPEVMLFLERSCEHTRRGRSRPRAADGESRRRWTDSASGSGLSTTSSSAGGHSAVSRSEW